MTDKTFGDVTVSSTGAVGVVVFARPPNNFFDIELIGCIADALAYVDERDELRASVLASEGKSFCAGADFARAQDGRGSEPGALYREGVRIFEGRKPVVAAVQGAAIGGGMGLAMAADFRVVSPETRLSANFVKLGFHPGFGLTHTLPQIVGRQRAALLFYTGRRIDGEEAFRIGVADVVVHAEQLRDRALALATEIAEGAPIAVESTRATLRAGLVEAVRKQTDHEASEQAKHFQTEDCREGIRAVAERRPGVWARR